MLRKPNVWEQQTWWEQDASEPSCQPTITVSLLLDALNGVHSCETDRTLCVSARKRARLCERVKRKEKKDKKKPGQMQPNCSCGLGEWMSPVVIHSILLDLWIVSKSCYLAHDAPGWSCSNQICLLLPVRRQENPQETPSSIGGSFYRGGGSIAIYVRSLRLCRTDPWLWYSVCRNPVVCVALPQIETADFNGRKMAIR